MKNSVVIGGVYEHFKRDKSLPDTDNSYRYKVLEVAIHTETNEKLVIYQEMGSNFKKTYARPFDMFTGKVDGEKYPEHKGEERFKFLYRGVI